MEKDRTYEIDDLIVATRNDIPAAIMESLALPLDSFSWPVRRGTHHAEQIPRVRLPSQEADAALLDVNRFEAPDTNGSIIRSRCNNLRVDWRCRQVIDTLRLVRDQNASRVAPERLLTPP
jgi:hypothetical protein